MIVDALLVALLWGAVVELPFAVIRRRRARARARAEHPAGGREVARRRPAVKGYLK